MDLIAEYFYALQESGVPKILAIYGNCGRRWAALMMPRSHFSRKFPALISSVVALIPAVLNFISPCVSFRRTLWRRCLRSTSNSRFRRLIRAYFTFSGNRSGAGGGLLELSPRILMIFRDAANQIYYWKRGILLGRTEGSGEVLPHVGVELAQGGDFSVASTWEGLARNLGFLTPPPKFRAGREGFSPED